MRLSVDPKDSGYDPFKAGGCRVRVNGEDVTFRCQTADEERGKALCYKLDEDGKYVLNGTGDDFIMEVLQGEVKIDLDY